MNNLANLPNTEGYRFQQRFEMKGFRIFLSAIDAWLALLEVEPLHIKWEKIDFWIALDGAITPWI